MNLIPVDLYCIQTCVLCLHECDSQWQRRRDAQASWQWPYRECKASVDLYRRTKEASNATTFAIEAICMQHACKSLRLVIAIIEYSALLTCFQVSYAHKIWFEKTRKGTAFLRIVSEVDHTSIAPLDVHLIAHSLPVRWTSSKIRNGMAPHQQLGLLAWESISHPLLPSTALFSDETMVVKYPPWCPCFRPMYMWQLQLRLHYFGLTSHSAPRRLWHCMKITISLHADADGLDFFANKVLQVSVKGELNIRTLFFFLVSQSI